MAGQPLTSAPLAAAKARRNFSERLTLFEDEADRFRMT